MQEGRPHRKEKLESLLEHTLSGILTRDFNFQGALVTVLSVEMEKKNLQARVRVGIIPHEKELLAYTELKKREPEVRHQILKSTRLRYVPKFVFEIAQEGTPQTYENM